MLLLLWGILFCRIAILLQCFFPLRSLSSLLFIFLFILPSHTHPPKYRHPHIHPPNYDHPPTHPRNTVTPTYIKKNYYHLHTHPPNYHHTYTPPRSAATPTHIHPFPATRTHIHLTAAPTHIHPTIPSCFASPLCYYFVFYILY